MKKTLTLGSLLVVFLFLMLPTVTAAEAKIAQSSIPSPDVLEIQTTYLMELQEKYKDGPYPQFILITLAILLLKLLRWGVLFIILIILSTLKPDNTTGVTF